MTVSQKDFIATAEIIKEVSSYSGYAAHSRMFARRMAEYFTTQNTKFDKERFLKACGVEE